MAASVVGVGRSHFNGGVICRLQREMEFTYTGPSAGSVGAAVCLCCFKGKVSYASKPKRHVAIRPSTPAMILEWCPLSTRTTMEVIR